MGSPCSLSLPSEPPDITNWFSSYVYESPELDSEEKFGDSNSEKGEFRRDENKKIGEKVEIVCGFEKLRKRDEELDSNRICPIGLHRPRSSSSVDKKHESQSLSLDQDFSCSSSILSEPPHIRNWFSSYEYESPLFNSTDEFRDCGAKENELEKDGFIAEYNNTNGEKCILEELRETRRVDEEIVRDKVQSEVLVKCKSSCLDDTHVKQGSDKSSDTLGGKGLHSQPDLFLQGTCEKIQKEKTLENQGSSKFNTVQNSSCKGSQCKLQEEFPEGTGFIPLHTTKSSNSNYRNSLIQGKLMHTKDLAPERLQNDVPKRVDRLLPAGDLKFVTGNEIGNKENGPVTARKSRFYVERPQDTVDQVTVMGDENVSRIRRKALAERTNFEGYGVSEVTGKWRCPQRRKLNLGPPLKQLRLEQWVRRE